MVAGSSAHAQSTRYPADPADADRDAEGHSHVWDSALDPERRPYEELIRTARHLLDDHSRDSATAAIDKLDDAIRRLPNDPRAYALRGEANLTLRQFTPCADDLAFADDHATSTAPSPERDRLQLSLGICQSRAGRLADAERTLAHAVVTAPRGDQWMRLGEVRIALGKLDEAIDALNAARDAGDGQQAMIEWLVATAYDRARRTGEADEHAAIAARYDQTFTTIINTPYPLLGPGEVDYLMGLAYRANPNPTPEYALLYFRHFLKLAPDSPWRRRAGEHLRDLSSLDWPQTIRRNPIGGALLDVPAAQLVVRKAMPALRACLAKIPGSVYTVTITRDGPHSPETARDRPHYTMPPEGVKVEASVNLDAVPAAADDAVKKCVGPLGEHLALPPVKERADTWYTVWFLGSRRPDAAQSLTRRARPSARRANTFACHSHASRCAGVSSRHRRRCSSSCRSQDSSLAIGVLDRDRLERADVGEILRPSRAALERDQIFDRGDRHHRGPEVRANGTRERVVEDQRFLDEDIDLGRRMVRTPQCEHDHALVGDPGRADRRIGQIDRADGRPRTITESLESFYGRDHVRAIESEHEIEIGGEARRAMKDDRDATDDDVTNPCGFKCHEDGFEVAWLHGTQRSTRVVRRSALEECDRDTVAALVRLARAKPIDRLMRREVRADRGAQRAGAVAVNDERGVATREQALVEKAIDRGDGFVCTLAANVDRRVDRARGRATTRGHAVDEDHARPVGLVGRRLALAIDRGGTRGAMRVHQHLRDRNDRAHLTEADLDLAVVGRRRDDLAAPEPRHDHGGADDE